VDVPPRLRTMADIRALHRPWCLAVATGLLQVGGGWVSGGPALERWPPGDADLLAAWLTALRAVCAAESDPQDEDSVRLLAMALLAVLRKDGDHRTGGLWGPVHAALHDLCDRYDKSSWEPLHAADRYDGPETRTPLAGLLALLAELTSGHAGSTRSRWSRRSRATGARTTRSAWRTKATPRWSTCARTTPKNPSHSTWPRSTASWPRSARRRSEMAPRAMNHGGGEPSLASLIERSAELKRALVDFALSPRFERHLEQFMLEAADPYQELSEGEAIGVIDRFALQHRLPNGKTMLDQFLAGRPDLTAADREMLRGWRDPVEGIFEIRRKDRDSLVLLNLLDDLEYRVYSNMGPAAFRRLPKGGFVHVRLVPICPVPGAWLVSGSMSAYRKSGAAQIAQAALALATKQPELVYRNPEKIEQAWTQMREDRAAFVEFFGGDELVLPPAEAEERLNAYYRHRQEAALARQPAARRPRNLPGVDAPAFELPPELADAGTIGIIYDETDGLNFYNEYGMLRALFADPVLAAGKQYADMLRGYLRSETIGPLPFRRLAAAHPDTVDAVFRKVLRKPGFTWAEHGEALMRRRKPWYYEHEPRPGISVIGARLSELVRR